MRVLTIVIVFAASAVAQENAPIGILRGDLVAWSGTSQAGSLTFRTVGNLIFRCGFDDETWFEHENEQIAVGAIRPGDHLELLADQQAHSTACYARTVQVVESIQPRRTPDGKPSFRIHNSATESFAPRGDITLSGIVGAIDGKRFTIRSRDGGKQLVLLRSDTRYLGDGLPMARQNLEPQTLVFVRAGHNLDGDLEAYTIIWGKILEVRN